MDRSAHRALPSPYSEIFPAFGAGAAVTHAAGLGGKRFVDFSKPHACVSAFVLQHGSKCAPARIEHRLGLSGLCESGGIHVADEDSTVGLHQSGAQLVQEIFAPIRNLGVNRSGSVSIAGALGAGQHGFQVAVKALGLDRRQSLITARGMLVLHSQAQDPNSGNSRAGHPYSIPKNHLITPWQTSRNASRGRHARLRVSLSLAGLKASVSRGGIG
jgi:hypothetical protein